MTVIHLSSRHGAASTPGAADVGDWSERATCREEDPELFFPVGNSPQAMEQEAAAKNVCRRCPVVTECLQWALNDGQQHGVWGGKSEWDRRLSGRRAEYARSRSNLQRGQELALKRGVDVIVARMNGQTEQCIAEWAGVRTFAVRHALRILLPGDGPTRADLTALERVLLNEDTLLVLTRADRTDQQIATMLRTQAAVIEHARTILGHRAAAMLRIQEAVG